MKYTIRTKGSIGAKVTSIAESKNGVVTIIEYIVPKLIHMDRIKNPKLLPKDESS